MTASSEKRPLQAHIHTGDWAVMEAFIQILKENILALLFFCDVCRLGHELIQEDGGDVVVSKGDGQ